MKATVEQIPLDWTGFRFFTDFMKAVDPRLLQAPIYGNSVDLNSKWSVNLLDTKAHLQTWIKSFVPNAHHFYKNIQVGTNSRNEWKRIEPILRDVTCPLIQSTLPQNPLKLKADNAPISRRYLTLLFYLREVEKRFNKKIGSKSVQ